MHTQSAVRRENTNPNLPLPLPLLWVFLSLNYIVCDLLSNMEPSVIRGLMEGGIAGLNVTEGFLLFAGITLEIPVLMVLLSAVLPYRANRIANVCAAGLMIVCQIGSLPAGSGITLHYAFFSILEILGNASVIALIFRRKRG